MFINYCSESIWSKTLTNFKIIKSIAQIIDSNIMNRWKTIQFTSMNHNKKEHFMMYYYSTMANFVIPINKKKYLWN